jgi:hypothetical protein
MNKKLHLLLSAAVLFPLLISSQNISFVNQSSLLPTSTFYSGNAVAVVDMNGDGKDDIVRDSANKKMYIEYQQVPNGNFSQGSFIGSFGSSNPWGLCVGDYDNNGFNDVFQGNNGSGFLYTANATGTNFTFENMTSVYGGGSVFTQGCNFADIDNDGKLDVFICHDSGMPKIYKGNGAFGGWVPNQALMPLAQVPSSDNSGNYASIWTDINADGYIDLMITHCRQGVTNAADARRIDQVFINNGNGTYTQDVTNWTGLRDGEQGWSTAWGDIDNDGDMDCFVLNQTVNAKMQVNNGAGVFTDIMSTTGLANPTTWFGENATFQDFDNDGYVDLLLSGDSSFLYRNNHNSTFTLISPNVMLASTGRGIRGHAVGDLNGDGFLDVYATYCSLYNSASTTRSDRMWFNDCPNQGNTNHWIKFYLNGVQSNKNGIGAIVKIYGSFGVQVREVRSGEAYGTQNSFTVHFGLGSATSIDSVIVQWPSGVVDETQTLGADQTVSITEGGFPLSTHNLAPQSLVLNVYPNPMTDQSYIRLDHFATIGLNNLSVNIYDLNGKVVYSQTALQQSILAIDRSKFANGLYMVEVTDNKGHMVGSQKLLVQ